MHAGLYLDAQAGLEFLLSHPGLDQTRLLVFGRSLGGAVALDLASRPDQAQHLLGVIVENTFSSIPEMARVLFGWRLLRWLPDFCYKNQVGGGATRRRIIMTHAQLILGKKNIAIGSTRNKC